ncbi:RES domain-containing protein [Halpernia humi]|uniref:RES domain-containing protein n=1 Tax=Halpernia humi TaxID=493375 RepID=A0A1H6ATK8_9FLAO|nr:RES family NAD+ phosphorylase [Halpernia humi]SEG51365.1 RES domain-containing protein [Halpernia humi]
MLVYRLVHRKYADSLFASGIEGRWNFAGQKVLYTAKTIALAYLELMHQRKGLGFNDDFKIMLISIPDSATFDEINSEKLPVDWRNFRNYAVCQTLSEEWFVRRNHLLLKVPSAVVPQNFNIVINSEHPLYKEVEIIDVLDFIPDYRLENILKKYN